MNVTHSERSLALRSEYTAYRNALADGDRSLAWYHLERAHIIAQPLLGEHLRSHWVMLRLAACQIDIAEVAGQVLRLTLVIPGNITGRLPRGNNGRARASAFRPMAVPPDLERFA